MWLRRSTRLSGVIPTLHRCASSSEGSGHTRLPTGTVHQLQLSRLHHGPRGQHPPSRGRPPPTRRDRERHPRPEIRRGAEPSAFRALRSQRRLDIRSGTGSQPRPLDHPHQTGRVGWDHQDPAQTVLLSGWPAHTLGTPSHHPPFPAMALGSAVQQRPETTALSAASTLKTSAVCPTAQRLAQSHRVATLAPAAATCAGNLVRHYYPGPSTYPLPRLPQPDPNGSAGMQPYELHRPPFILCLNAPAHRSVDLG